MKALLTIAVVALVAYFALNRPSDVPISQANAPARGLIVYPEVNRGQAHPCVGKARCVVVYLAPHCPRCLKTVALLRRLRNVSAEGAKVAVMVVLGPAENGEWSDYLRLAHDVGGTVYLDPDNGYWDTIAPQVGPSTPVWMVFDGEGRMLSHLDVATAATDDLALRSLIRGLDLQQLVDF